MSKKSFFLIIQDHDRKLFAVQGPMSDDTRWNEAVVAERSKGREITCDAILTSRAATAPLAAAEFKKVAVEYAQVPVTSLIP